MATSSVTTSSGGSISCPPSDSTVRVRLIDTTAVMTVKAQSFVEPAQKGHEVLNLTAVAFLIEHEPSSRKILFDLGVRKDYWNLAPVIQKRLGNIIPGLKVDRGVPEILEGNGTSLDSISSVIWSHHHWDHIGNTSLFPPSTEVVVGPGFKASPTLLPGYPDNPDSPLKTSDFQGRNLVEIGFENAVRIGGFAAHDFFGDGSFYLLDTPGHCLGHMCGLARTTAGTGTEESTFLLLGGDICHYAADIRPTKAFPIPDPIPEGVLDDDPAYFPSPCPSSLFTDHHPILTSPDDSPDDRKTTPFYRVSTDQTSAYVDPAVGQGSVDRLVAFESSPNVLVCLAHDPALIKHLPTFNQNPRSDLNDWCRNGRKEKCRWEWLNELPRKNATPGRKPIVQGFWRDGRPWDRGSF